MAGPEVSRTDSPEAMSDADTISHAAAGVGWVVHPDIRVGTHRIVHVDRGQVAIRAICTATGALRLGSRQVRPGGRVENTTSLAQVLAWLSAGEGEL